MLLQENSVFSSAGFILDENDVGGDIRKEKDQN
jgi:hypothetical protein